jgi:riboflavin biosynthesis pyrimidine reductase
MVESGVVLAQKAIHEKTNDEVELFFSDNVNGESIEIHSETEYNGGRSEKRICRKTGDIGFLSCHCWPGLKRTAAR